MTIFCCAGVRVSQVALEISSGSNMNQKDLSRAVVTALAFSCRR